MSREVAALGTTVHQSRHDTGLSDVQLGHYARGPRSGRSMADERQPGNAPRPQQPLGPSAFSVQPGVLASRVHTTGAAVVRYCCTALPPLHTGYHGPRAMPRAMPRARAGRLKKFRKFPMATSNQNKEPTPSKQSHPGSLHSFFFFRLRLFHTFQNSTEP